jgi:hypothetical protein
MTAWADMEMSQQASWTSIVSSAFYTMASEYSRTDSTYPSWTFTIANNLIYFCGDVACETAWGLTSTDPYTLLPAWGTQVPNNAPVGTNFEVAHLWSGKSFTGGILGLGYQAGRYSLGAPVGLPSWSQALLVGHETGHNFNGDHGNRGIASPGRATSYAHTHVICDLSLLGICLLSHNVQYTHYTLMWPYLVGTSGTNEQFFELGSTNQFWMQNCNQYSHTSGAYTAGGGGFGYYCNN